MRNQSDVVRRCALSSSAVCSMRSTRVATSTSVKRSAASGTARVWRSPISQSQASEALPRRSSAPSRIVCRSRGGFMVSATSGACFRRSARNSSYWSSLLPSCTPQCVSSASTPPGSRCDADLRQPTAGSTQWNAVAEKSAAKSAGSSTSSNRPTWNVTRGAVADAALRGADHVRPRIDGVDDQAAGGQQLRQLPGAAADLEHARSGSEPSARERDVDELPGIAGANLVVLLGDAVEDLPELPESLRIIHSAHDNGASGAYAAAVRILLVSQMYPGAADPDLGTFVAQVERALVDRGHEVQLAVLDTRSGGKLRYLTLAREDASRAAELPSRRRLRALPRPERADRRRRAAHAARRHRARARRPQHRLDPRHRRRDGLRRPPRGHRRLRLGVPAPRARDEAARRTREDRRRLERRRPRAVRRRAAAGRPAALPLRGRADGAEERRPPRRRVRGAGGGDADLRRRRPAAAAARRASRRPPPRPRAARRDPGAARGQPRPLPAEPAGAARAGAARGDGVRPLRRRPRGSAARPSSSRRRPASSSTRSTWRR